MAKIATLILYMVLGVAIAFTLGTVAALIEKATLFLFIILLLGLATITPAGHSVWTRIFDDDDEAILMRILIGGSLLAGFTMSLF